MKAKDLIAALQSADPSGEEECCVGNVDILCVVALAAYYDGPLEVLNRDKNNMYYNVVGADIRRSGVKVNIHVHSIEDALWENPRLPVSVEDSQDGCHQKMVDKWRAEAIALGR